jgi:hypothetical protein
MTMTRLALALVALAAVAASAQDATLAKISGPVYYKTEGMEKFARAKGGEGLIYGDTVKTGKGGVAHLVLKDDRGAVLVREEAYLVLEGTPARTELNFGFGEFLIGLKKKLVKGESFRVRTPAAVAAVRGTLFWGLSKKDDKSSTYAGFGHTVAITARKKTVVLEPGKTIVIPFGQEPGEPTPSAVGLEYAANFAVDGSVQDLGALAETDKLKK